jgi:nucleoid DNA-binding protein
MTERNNITKKDLVEEIASRIGFTQVETKLIVENFLDAISDALVEGKNIELRGFGRFKLKKRDAHKARNPRTGEQVDIEAQVRPVFEASRELNKKFENPSDQP